MSYIGQTGRPFATRFREHYRDYTHGHTQSKFAEHLLLNHHSIGPMGKIMEPLHYISKGQLMNTIEKFHIYKETKKHNQINDRHTIQPNPIFETLLHTNPARNADLPPPP
jgi:hypothetical protein